MRVDQLCAELRSLPVFHHIDIEYRAGASRPQLADTDLVDVVHDSRQTRPGMLYCAVPGRRFDGHDFVDAATGHGASALLVERWVDTTHPQIKVPSVRETMPFAAAVVHRHPSREISVFGITGTNGKTTTTHLLADILTAAGRRCSVMGTLSGIHTTPESTDLQRRFRNDADAGIEFVALEVSSHALDQHRVDAVEFAVAAFSNLTTDHLDYHLDMEKYFAAKSLLFDGRAAHELINCDDPWGRRLAGSRGAARRVSLDEVEIVHETLDGTEFIWRGRRTGVGLPGRMNVANALMAAEAAVVLGLGEDEVALGLAEAHSVPGRMQRVPSTRTDVPTVIVDYSHTPDSIERALATIRSVVGSQRLSIVFGCGGDRDRTKRPAMGRAAEVSSDRVYLTSDNPRSENPLLIMADALAGMNEPGEVVVEPDRRAAIRRAIVESGPNDVVLIAGKGHEKTQTIGSTVVPFDDLLVAQELLEETTR